MGMSFGLDCTGETGSLPAFMVYVAAFSMRRAINVTTAMKSGKQSRLDSRMMSGKYAHARLFIRVHRLAGEMEVR
jgi:hypothetical protein